MTEVIKIDCNYENVILITIDSLRWDAIFNRDGSVKKELKYFNKIVNNAINFKNAFSNGSGTPAAFPSIISSTYPLMYGGYKGIKNNRTTIAEVLQKNGVNTIGILNNAYLSKYYGYDRGFDIFYEPITKEISYKKKLMNKLSEFVHKSQFLLDISIIMNMIIDIKPTYLEADEIIKSIMGYMFENKKISKPFFLHIHFMDVHIPYYSTKIDYKKEKISLGIIKKLHFKILSHPYLKSLLTEDNLIQIKFLYFLKVQFIDFCLGKLFELFKTKSFLNNTLVILTSDHGEEFCEHNEFIHKPKLYNELIHVPLLMYSDKLKDGLIVDDLVEHIDIAPTILKSLGINNYEGFIGKNLFEVINGNNKKEFIISEVAQYPNRLEMNFQLRKTSIRSRQWKFIYDEGLKKVELYDIINDPNEKNNISKDNKDLLLEFFRLLLIHQKKEELTNIRKYIPNRKII